MVNETKSKFSWCISNTNITYIDKNTSPWFHPIYQPTPSTFPQASDLPQGSVFFPRFWTVAW